MVQDFFEHGHLQQAGANHLDHHNLRYHEHLVSEGLPLNNSLASGYECPFGIAGPVERNGADEIVTLSLDKKATLDG